MRPEAHVTQRSFLKCRVCYTVAPIGGSTEMQNKRIPINLIALAFVTLPIAPALAAQDKYRVSMPGGLGFAEFRGYEDWQSVGPSLTDAQNVIRVIPSNPVMIQAYREGVPGNGKPFPDGSKIARSNGNRKRLRTPLFP